uniref:VWFA domain-containing protein n=1 Tax=Echeneis naucrates TaxID=173247 RepID=A0A665U200_ECHNA
NCRGKCAKATVADIVFLVDGSSSIGPSNFEAGKEFLRNVVSGFDIGPDKVRVGLAQYSDQTYQEFLLKDHMDKQALLSEISEFPYRTGGTETGKAIDFLLDTYFTKEAGSRASQRVPQIAVIITDGDSTDDVVAPAQRLRQHGVIVFAIGVGDANQNELQAIASRPTQRFLFTINSYQALAALRGDCKAAKLADIVFIVDESGSIGTSNFQLVRTFLYSIINGLEVSTTRVRVGIVTYNDRATAQVYLNSFSDKKELLNFIKILPYHGGGTRTGAALKFAQENVFIQSTGSRKDRGVQQVAVVITDGESQDNVSQPAAELRRAGVTVYSVGVKDAKEAQLVEMASYPSKKHVFIVDSFVKLNTWWSSLMGNPPTRSRLRQQP